MNTPVDLFSFEDNVLEELNRRTPEQRVEVFEMIKRQFCIACGMAVPDNHCNCRNDD